MPDREIRPVHFLWMLAGILVGAGAYELARKLVGWGDPHSPWTDRAPVAVFCLIGGTIGLMIRSREKGKHA